MQSLMAVLLTVAYVLGAIHWIRAEETRQGSGLTTLVAVLGGILLAPRLDTLAAIVQYLLLALVVFAVLAALGGR